MNTQIETFRAAIDAANAAHYADLRKCGHAHRIGTVALNDSEEWQILPISE
jgi:hypothetical protein